MSAVRHSVFCALQSARPVPPVAPGRKASLRLLMSTGLAALASICTPDGAIAAQAYSPVLAGPVVGGVAGVPGNLSGFIDIVPGPSMAVVGATVTGFKTQGADGSGGGAGLGGALFVGTGAVVNITSSSFLNNVAVGGNGGNGSLLGGSLNGGGLPSGPIGLTSLVPGVPGLPGVTPYGASDQYAFGDGNGNGLAGTGGNQGLNLGLGLVPFTQGGAGGAGGDGQSGWATNPVRIQAVTDATTNVGLAGQEVSIAGAQQTISIMIQTADAVALTGATIAAAASAAAALNPLDAVAAALLVAKFTVEIGTLTTFVAADALQLINDAASIALASQTLTLATGQLTQATQSLLSWQAGFAAGIYGNGGEGGKGGQGGLGGFGASGGAGGNGGRGGIGFTPLFPEANGGAGGNAGISGFGAGGAQGGNGGYSALLGVAGGERGTAGAGGIAGFGGGVGSSGTGLGVDTPTGGGGGSGLGGAIFVQTGGTVLVNGNSLFMGNSTVAGKSLNGGTSGQAAGNSIFLQGASQLIVGALPTDVTTFIGPQSIADNSAIGIGGFGDGSVTVASGTLVYAPGTTNKYAGPTTVGSVLNPLSIPGTLSAVLRANDGDGLPQASKLVFTNAGILQTNQDFNRFVGTNPNNVEWQGSGGFAYWNGVVSADGSVPSAVPGNLNVTLSGNQPLVWGLFGFVPVGSALVFGAKDATGSVTFTNNILTGLAGPLPGTTVNITVVSNDAQTNVLEPGLSIPANISTLKYTGSIIGLGGVSFNDLFNDGTIYLLNNQYYTGPTFLNGGLLSLQNKGSIAPSMLLAITRDSAVFDITQTAGPTSVGGLAGVGTVRMGATNFSVTAGLGPLIANYGGNITGSANFTVAGGHQRLSGQNSYTGVTTIAENATLDIADTGSILSSIGVVNNGLFSIAPTSNGASIQTLSGKGTVELGDQYLTLTTASGEFSGSINGTGGLVLAGGAEVLSGVSSYSGRTDIASGTTLTLKGAGSIANSSTVNVIGTLEIGGTTAGASLVSLAGTGSVTLADKPLVLTSAHDRFDGVISGSGTVGVTGGTQVLGNVNIYTGRTTVGPAGSLVLDGAGAIAASAGLTNDGYVDISTTTNGASIKTLSGNGTLNLGDRTLTLTAANDEFAGNIFGAGNVVVNAGTQTFSGLNDYTGKTTVLTGATLNLNKINAIAKSSLVNVDGVLDLTTSGGASISTLSGSGSVRLGASLLQLYAPNDSFSGVISGPGGLWLLAGSETLTGVNSYTGATYLDNSRLVLTGQGSIATSAFVASANSIIDISGTTSGTAFQALAGTGSVLLGARSLTITNGAFTDYSGVISGTGGLSFTGGTSALSGVNSFTGAVAVSNGATLAIVGSGSIATASSLTNNGVFDILNASGNVGIRTMSGAATGSVVLGPNRLVLTAAGGSYAGTIGGTGGLSILNGTQTLTGVSSYSGGTLVGNATLTINSNAALGADAGTLTLDNSRLVASSGFTSSRDIVLASNSTVNNGGNTLSLTGTISGAGGLTADGGGRTTITGVNSYAGGTTIVGGTTVAINSDAALGAPAGTVNIASGRLLMMAPITSNRAFYVGRTSTIDAAGYAVTLNGPIYLEALNGAALFSGTTRASGGSWSVTPTMLTIDSGTVLSGAGTITMPSTVNGRVSPGNSPGTLTFASTLTMGASAILDLEIDGTGTGTGAGSYDRLLTNGTLTVAGTLQARVRGISGAANNNYTPPIGQSFVVAQSAQGVSGSFGSMVQPASGLLAGSRLDALYSDRAITLYAVPISYQRLGTFGISLNANQLSTAASLDALRPVPGVRTSGSVSGALAQIYSLGANQITTQLDHLAGTGYGDALLSVLNANRLMGNLIGEQTAVRRGDIAISGNDVVEVGGLTFWASGAGSSFKADNVGQTAFRTVGTQGVVGVDKRFGEELVGGFALSYGRSNVYSPALGSQIDVDQQAVTAYVGWSDNDVYVDGRAGIGFDHYSSTRSLYGINQSARGTGNGVNLSASSKVGYRYEPLETLYLMPEAALELNYANRGQLTETQAGAVALNVAGKSMTSVRTKMGLRMEGAADFGGGTLLTMSLQGHWIHELGDRFAVTQASFVEAATSPMSVTSVFRDTDMASVGGGLNLAISQKFSIWARYSSDLAKFTNTQTGSAGLRFAW